MIKDLRLDLKATISYILEELMEDYGCDITLGELIRKFSKEKGYKCPKCEGKGLITIKSLYYPKYEYDFGYRTEHKDIECDLCKGTGFTDKPMKPRMVQDGWEVDDEYNGYESREQAFGIFKT